MASKYRCFHSRTPEQQERDVISPEAILDGVVVCQHGYGVGVYVPEREVWGHVNVTAMGVVVAREDFADYPVVGAHLRLHAEGRLPNGQLRLAVI